MSRYSAIDWDSGRFELPDSSFMGALGAGGVALRGF
jgi:hypothetical protein